MKEENSGKTEQKENVDKEINQKDTMLKAEEELNNSMYFYHQILEKLQNDSICFSCKEELKKANINHVLPIRTCDKGIAVFASVCEDCVSKEIKKEEELKLKKDKEDKEDKKEKE